MDEFDAPGMVADDSGIDPPTCVVNLHPLGGTKLCVVAARRPRVPVLSSDKVNGHTVLQKIGIDDD
ncbi:hypothetical protein ACTMTF_03200 [Nonomuraea sp. ZG12]|uniref:hypothetical protein n=1 Tax=Nonomuraea sp. ZG12 TaxID=3452207 RepID=UPI003F897D1F